MAIIGKVILWANIRNKTGRIAPCKRAMKTVPENCVFSCVSFYLRSLGCFERCWVHFPVQVVLKMKKLAPKPVLKTRNIGNITKYAYLELLLLLAKPNSVSEKCLLSTLWGEHSNYVRAMQNNNLLPIFAYIACFSWKLKKQSGHHKHERRKSELVSC